MNIPGAIGIVVTCALVLLAVGAVLGGSIGTYLPGYYRSVFQGGHEPGFDPIAVGVGQGATQGIAGGILVGVILVGILVWRERRASGAGVATDQQVTMSRRPMRPSGWIFIAAGSGLLMSLGSCSVGVIVGALIGEQGAHDRRSEEEQRLIEEALASDSLLQQIEIRPRSNGGVLIYGSVQTTAEHVRLRDIFTRVLGESRAADLIGGVEIHAAPTAADVVE